MASDGIDPRQRLVATSRLSTEEAAARLGVKKETIYAYVSRGILGREKAVDGKASTFDPDEVDRLRRERVDGRPGRLEAAVTTSIAEVRDGYVAYRGTSIEQLAKEGVGYERTAALLWDVPESGPWLAPPDLVDAIGTSLALLPPGANLIDRLLTSTIVASTHDAFRHARDPMSAATSVRHLIAATVDAMALRQTKGKAVSFKQTASIAERLWPRLTTAARTNAHVLNTTLMLLADHGMASSTLAARIAASTRGGPHAAIIAGLGALNGPLHGAAGQAVHELLVRAESDGVESALSEVLRSHGRVPGIGHFVHRTSDPRFPLMMDALMQSSLSPKRLDVMRVVIEQTNERIAAPHNIDFSLGSFTYVAGMPADSGELIFAIARILGWTAHALEEHEEAPLRFRPIGRYEATRPRPAPGDFL